MNIFKYSNFDQKRYSELLSAIEEEKELVCVIDTTKFKNLTELNNKLARLIASEIKVIFKVPLSEFKCLKLELKETKALIKSFWNLMSYRTIEFYGEEGLVTSFNECYKLPVEFEEFKKTLTECF